LGFELGQLDTRQFPDGETYLRFMTNPEGRSIALLCTLEHPNEKFLPLIFAAATARELGAAKIGLIAPYLAYMRQDRRFKPGEAVTSQETARLLSGAFDWLVTVDPHLHRYSSLADIYTIPTRVVHAAPLVSQWIKKNVPDPLIVGPDAESEQWVSAVAKDAGAPFSVLEKVRRGDREVEISLRNLDSWTGRTAVLVDDIISSGRTMIEAVRLLTSRGWAPPLCIAVHGLFADGSDMILAQAGARVVTSNSVSHRTNDIDVVEILAEAVRYLSSLSP
jgi:ribose-phosphate pyrophosphokinase